jgi:hypothetical protein
MTMPHRVLVPRADPADLTAALAKLLLAGNPRRLFANENQAQHEKGCDRTKTANLSGAGYGEPKDAHAHS